MRRRGAARRAGGVVAAPEASAARRRRRRCAERRQDVAVRQPADEGAAEADSDVEGSVAPSVSTAASSKDDGADMFKAKGSRGGKKKAAGRGRGGGAAGTGKGRSSAPKAGSKRKIESDEDSD